MFFCLLLYFNQYSMKKSTFTIAMEQPCTCNKLSIHYLHMLDRQFLYYNTIWMVSFLHCSVLKVFFTHWVYCTLKYTNMAAVTQACMHGSCSGFSESLIVSYYTPYRLFCFLWQCQMKDPSSSLIHEMCLRIYSSNPLKATGWSTLPSHLNSCSLRSAMHQKGYS